MKKLICFLSTVILLQLSANAQTISTDRMLDLIGKTVNDPLFLQVKQQEDMISNAWNRSLSVWFYVDKDTIRSISFKNGEKRYQSTERYGVYNKPLPLSLNWSMASVDLMIKLGAPTKGNYDSDIKYYSVGDRQIIVNFENNKPVSMSFSKTPPKRVYAPGGPENKEVLNIDTLSGKATVNWPALRQVLISVANMKPLTGKDSVDYIGQVYYSTPYKARGFERTAVKRIKRNQQWYYEAFYKTYADSNQVKNAFIGLYQALKKTIADNSDDDFILVAIAKDPISSKPTLNWMAGWSLYTNYKTLPPGLQKMRLTLLLNKMPNVFKNNISEYTIKLYIGDPELNYDVFTWDTPKE